MPEARTTEQIASMKNAPSRTPRGSNSSVAVRVDPPSTDQRTFAGRERLYQISYPSNWQVYEGSGHAVTLAPEGGISAVNGNSEVVYGAILNHYEPFGNVRPRGTDATIEEATQDLIKQIQQSSPYLKVVRGSGQTLRLAGGKGLGASLTGTSPATGNKERVTAVTRQLSDGHLIYMLFITPDEAARSYGGVLTSMVQSIRVDDNRQH